MRLTIGITCAAALLTGGIVGHLAAQGGPPAPPGPATGVPAAGPAGQGRGRTGGGPGRGFPAQQRQLADQATLERGKLLYEINCRSCHGADLRGGETGGPNLLRSQLALTDQHGELIIPVVKQGRQTPGMPPMPPLALPDADIVSIAEHIHAVQATSRGQGSPPAGPPVQLNIVVGNPKAGEAYFQKTCTACHTLQAMQGIATRIADPMQLQNAWVAGGGRGGRGAGRGGGTPVTVTVTLPGGQRFEGPLVRVDDFMVILTMPDGIQRSFARNGDVPRVEINDPRAGHRKLLPTYTDKDMHDVTAFLVTLK
jgi:cytochrome c oxidase cbb3-type subunit 3